MDSLNELAYDAELAGLSYAVHSDLRGLSVSLGGYNDKLPILAQRVLERLHTLEIKPERLAVITEQVKRGWQNFFLNQTYQISNYFTNYILAERQYTVMEKLKEIDGMSFLLSKRSICT
jgi:insulysin